MLSPTKVILNQYLIYNESVVICAALIVLEDVLVGIKRLACGTASHVTRMMYHVDPAVGMLELHFYYLCPPTCIRMFQPWA